MRLLLLLFSLSVTMGLSGQRSAYQFFSPQPTAEQPLPEGNYQGLHLDLPAISANLAPAPAENDATKSAATVELPLPDGTFASYRVYSASVFENKLNARFPNIRSYSVYGEYGMGRIAISSRGLVAMVRGPEGYFTIEPLEGMPGDYAIYNSDEFEGFMDEQAPALSCGFDGGSLAEMGDLNLGADAGARLIEKNAGLPLDLREYDLVMTNTGEFARRIGGNNVTVEEVVAAFNEAVNIINAIFQNEVGVRMRLLDISADLVYLAPESDPFSMSNLGRALLDQVITAFNIGQVPFPSYDLGHIFTAGCSDVGGVVSGAACTLGKTRGVTCVGGSVAGAAQRIMAHEIAHQFAVSHSWNNCPGSDDQRAGGAAFEPGSGSTIMSYSGACGSANNIGADDPYYSVGSLVQFINYTREGTANDCATFIETDNLQPMVMLDYEDGFRIPISTPFILEGTAIDDNEEDVLTYTWEQYDLGPATVLGQPEGNAPLFRSFAPSVGGHIRYFPELFDVTQEQFDRTEVLPDYERDMTFRLTARDNHAPAGAAVWEEVKFRTTEMAGPFLVNDPDLTDGVWKVGQYREVTWDVANTDRAPVNARSVDILMSDDGGFTFDSGIVLARGVANTGSAFVTVPDFVDTDMVIMVRAADNIFFNLNETPFAVEPADVPGIIVEAESRYLNVCLPGEPLAIDIDVSSVLDYDGEVTISLDESTLPAGAEAAFTNPTLRPGESAILYLSVRDVNENGFFTLTLNVEGENLPATTRDIVLDLTSSSYADLMLVSPEEGAAIGLQTPFDWTEAASADLYDIEIATSPTFAENTLFSARYGLTETTFTEEDFFAENTVYYWRVRGTNECGPGRWRDVRSFRTANEVCTEYAPNDLPINLPGNGPAFSRTTNIFVDASGTISDVNIPIIDLRYQFMSKVKLTLISPQGTAVVLYDENCASTGIFNLGFNDEAPAEVNCPPDDRRVAQPIGNLSDFDGENTLGNWQLRLNVSQTGGSVGRINNWMIEFCAAGSAQALTVGNIGETMVDQLASRTIDASDLTVSSPGFEAGEILYTVTRAPLGGNLFVNGTLAAGGTTFTQADVDAGRLRYTNTDASLEVDDFGFVVTTPDGGYLSVNYHRFIIADVGVSTEDGDGFNGTLEVFPNPTGSDLFLRWSQATSGRPTFSVELFNLTGQRLLRRTVSTSARSSQLDLAALPAGIYLLRVDGSVRRVVKQ